MKKAIYRAFNHKKEVYRLSEEICKLRLEVREMQSLIKRLSDRINDRS